MQQNEVGAAQRRVVQQRLQQHWIAARDVEVSASAVGRVDVHGHPEPPALGGDERFELVNFIDGKRTVSEIRNALSAEYTPVGINIVAHYLDDLVKVKVVKWK